MFVFYISLLLPEFHETHTVQTCTVFSGQNLMTVLQKKISYVIKNNNQTRKTISLNKSKHT